MIRTAQEWLALPEAERGVALAEVLTPMGTKHKFGKVFECRKGRLKKCQHCMKNFPAHTKQNKCVPDPIVIDWNTAKYWQGKVDPVLKFFRELYMVVFDRERDLITVEEVMVWVGGLTKPEDAIIPLVAAAMAQDK